MHKHISHIIDFDRSDSIVPHGRVSNQLYMDIWESREFNLYGKQVPKKPFTEKDMRSLKELAENLNVNFKAENRKIEDKVYVPDIFENITDTLTIPLFVQPSIILALLISTMRLWALLITQGTSYPQRG